MVGNQTSNLFDLRDEIAVVIGGTGVLGGAMADALSAHGARVVIVGRNESRGLERVHALQAAGGEAFFQVADGLDAESLRRVCRVMESRYGVLTVLVNAAGGNRPDATLPPGAEFGKLPRAAWAQVFDLNLVAGALLPCQVFAEPMLQAGRGSIINVASLAGITPLSRVVAYSAAKAAVINLTQFLAREWAPRGVRVNALSPGFFPAEQNRALLYNENGKLTERGAQIVQHTPMGRFGEAQELAGAVVWLASHRAVFVCHRSEYHRRRWFFGDHGVAGGGFEWGGTRIPRFAANGCAEAANASWWHLTQIATGDLIPPRPSDRLAHRAGRAEATGVEDARSNDLQHARRRQMKRTPLTASIAILALAFSGATWAADEAQRLRQTPDDLLQGEVMAVAYSGFREGQHPDRGDGAVNPSRDEILEDLKILIDHGFRLIRMYDAGPNTQDTLEVIREHKLPIKVALGVWLDAELSNHEGCPWLSEPIPDEKLAANALKNEAEVETAIRLAKQYADMVVAVNVGNEALVEWNDHMVPPERVIAFVRQVKDSIEQPVTVAENYDWWRKHGTPLAAVDFLAVHSYPAWEGKTIDEALDFTIENIEAVHQALPDKPIVVFEGGWATTASEFEERANEANQKHYYNEVLDWATKSNITFSSSRHSTSRGRATPTTRWAPQKHWGLFHVDRTPKEVMRRARLTKRLLPRQLAGVILALRIVSRGRRARRRMNGARHRRPRIATRSSISVFFDGIFIACNLLSPVYPREQAVFAILSGSHSGPDD